MSANLGFSSVSDLNQNGGFIPTEGSCLMRISLLRISLRRFFRKPHKFALCEFMSYENYTVVISFNPWQAHIHFDPIGPVCGGAILDEETILTSVFCVVRPFSNPPQVGFFLWNWLIHLTHFASADFSWDNSRVVLLRQLWIVNYSIKSLSNNLSNENINIGVFLVFKAKRV